MQDTDQGQCSENAFMISRRGFIGSTAGLFAISMMPEQLSAATGYLPNTVVVILRGGVDGLSMLIPHSEPDYQYFRPEISNFSGRLLNLDSNFSLHPSLTTFSALYRRNDMSIFPAVGLPVRDRSHFRCQKNLENGLSGESRRGDGWMARLIESRGIRSNSQGLSIGVLPSIFSGTSKVIDWSPTWFRPMRDEVSDTIGRMYRNHESGMFREQLQHQSQWRILDAMQVPDDISRTQQAFLGAAKYISDSPSSVLTVIDVQGWDTHHRQGTDRGRLASILSDLDTSLGYFVNNIGAKWSNTTVVFVSEFGRSVKQNGTVGTDHGVAFPVFIAGGGIRGGILGDWPGLAAGDLVDGRDLRPTIDVRSIFKGVLREQYGVSRRNLNSRIFPASERVREFSGIVS